MSLLCALLGLTVLGVNIGCGSGSSCGFPAIYNFGDSNSDTGAISAAISEVPLPNGESFFGHSSGRFSDGRLIIDFIGELDTYMYVLSNLCIVLACAYFETLKLCCAAEKLQLPYLSPYLDSLGTNFRHGANFATGGSSIRPGGYSPFHLGIQLSQFIRFKSHSIALYKQQSPYCQSLTLIHTCNTMCPSSYVILGLKSILLLLTCVTILVTELSLLCHYYFAILILPFY